MKRLLLAIAILAALLPGASDAMEWKGVSVVGGGVSGGACTTVAVDYWQQFQSDFLSSPPTGWTITDGSSKASMSTSGERNLTSCPNGTADTDTYGLAYATGATAYAKYAFDAKSNLSLGFWYFAGSGYADWGGSNNTYFFICETDCSSGYINKFAEGTSPVDNSPDGPWQYGASAWYWVTIKWSRNSTSTIKIYNSSGEEEYSYDFTGFDGTAQSIIFNSNGGGATTIYFDDLLIDFTDSTFPLGP